MYLDDMHKAISEAKATLGNADAVVGEMAYLIRGRLHKADVAGYILTDLKRELRDWDINRKRWIR